MSTKVQQKKSSYKPKYQEKQKVVSTKFNFIFDQQKITFKTQIPELPTKLKSKPNEQSHKKKVDQLKSKMNALKQQRAKKKQLKKKGSQNFDQQIHKLQNNVQLGKKCLVVLNYDLQNIVKSLTEVQQKLQKKIRLLKNLQRGPRENKQQKKTYDEMTYQQLQVEQNKLGVRISTANLNKKQQTQINALLAKLARIKSNAPHGQKPKDNTASIEVTQDSIDRLKIVKQSLLKQQEETKYKVEVIQQNIQQYQDQVSDLEQKKRNPEIQAIVDQTKQLKQQIYKLRDQVAKLQQEFETKKTQYQYEQAKIQWIKWASEIQKRKNQQWEAQRQERRKQRLRQKNKQKNGQNKPTEPGKQQQEKPQRRIINRHQKQIDSCTFLISYCQGLIKAPQTQESKEETVQNSKNIESVLKSGEWSKMKDVQVIKSKKANLDEQQQKTDRIKKKKTVKKETEVPTPTIPQNFSHQFFVQHQFDSVRVVPPNKPEQVQATLKQLNTKLTYFLEHPEGGPTSQTRYDRGQKDKQKYTAEKYAKAKSGQRQKKVVNTEQFPSLN